MRVSVIGQGFVGRALTEAAQQSGHSVQGIEKDKVKIRELENLNIPITDDYSQILGSELVVIAVPTPLNENREPDLSYLEDACISMKPYISESTLVVNESTSYPGTLRDFIVPLIGVNCLYASAPERIDPGNSNWNIRNTPRLVSGLSEVATKRAFDFYSTICEQVVKVSSPEVAEAAKLLENTFRQVNIALVNEFAQLTSRLGISAYEVIDAASSKPYGFMPFFPSVGVGGHCIPVDPNYLSFIAEQLGFDTQFIKLANKVNLEMPKYLAKKIDEQYLLKDKAVQVSGITYKSGIADTRESPSWELVLCLRELGARVIWFDPLINEFKGEQSTPITRVDIGIIASAHQGVDFSNWDNGTTVIDLSISRDLKWAKFL